MKNDRSIGTGTRVGVMAIAGGMIMALAAASHADDGGLPRVGLTPSPDVRVFSGTGGMSEAPAGAVVLHPSGVAIRKGMRNTNGPPPAPSAAEVKAAIPSAPTERGFGGRRSFPPGDVVPYRRNISTRHVDDRRDVASFRYWSRRYLYRTGDFFHRPPHRRRFDRRGRGFSQW